MRKFLEYWPAMLAMVLVSLPALQTWADEVTSEQTTVESSTAEAGEESEATEEAVEQNKVRLAYLKIQGELPESPGQMSFFGDLGIDLRKTILRLDKAAQDKKIAGVVLEIRPMRIPRGKLNELRAAIARIRAAGKKVHAVMESARGTQYLLAAACDEIVMPEAGVILLPGVRAEFSYLKDMLDMLGLEADMMHVGAYKGAAEPLTRNSMSEPVRINRTAMVDDLFDQLVSTVAADRQLKIDEVRAIVDRGLLTTTEAKKAGLIDRIAYADEYRAQLTKQYQADDLVYVVNYGKKDIDTDFSGPMGMIKLFQAMVGSGSGGKKSKGAKVAIIYAVGPIMSGKSESNAWGSSTIGSETIVEALEEAANDKDVKAIVLRINSPGGSALASDLIWRATQALDIPIVASMGDVAASGGYYIAMGADQIIAEPGTITGSIGVVGGKIVFGGLYKKIGMSTDVISRGENSGLFSSTEKFSQSERKVVRQMMQDIYRLFTSKAAKGRKMPLEKLESLAGGQIYTGRDANRNGLVDELGTLKDAVQAAKQLAGLEADEEVDLMILPEPENPLESFFGADLEAEREAKILGAVMHLAPELGEPLRRAVQWQQVMREPVTLMMPFWVEIK